MSFLLVYVTHPSRPEAVRITTELLQNPIIACANYFPIESTYWWEGSLAHSEEIVTLYKTRKENYEKLKETVQSLHKYEIPCIMKLYEIIAFTF